MHMVGVWNIKKENKNEFIQGSKAEHVLGNEYTGVWQ